MGESSSFSNLVDQFCRIGLPVHHVSPLLPMYAANFGASPALVGLLPAAYAVFKLFAGPLFGVWSDRIGRKPVLVISQIGTILGLLCLAESTSLWMVFAARIVNGITAGGQSIAHAAIADATDIHQRANGYSKSNLAVGIGIIIGSMAPGLFAHTDSKVAIHIVAGLSLLSLIATRNISSIQKKSKSQRDSVSPKPTYRAIFQGTGGSAILLSLFLLYAAPVAFYQGFALYAPHKFAQFGHHFDHKDVGFVLGFAGCVLVFNQLFLFNPLMKRFGSSAPAFYGLLSSALGFFLLGQTCVAFNRLLYSVSRQE